MACTVTQVEVVDAMSKKQQTLGKLSRSNNSKVEAQPQRRV